MMDLPCIIAFRHSITLIIVWIIIQGRIKESVHLSVKDVEKWTKAFSQELESLTNSIMKTDELVQAYKSEGATANLYNAEDTLDLMVERLTKYLEKRKTLAENLKHSLESGSTVYGRNDDMKPKDWKCYRKPKKEEMFKCLEEHANKDYRFVDARPDELLSDDRNPSIILAPLNNNTEYSIVGQKNPNFYNLEVDTSHSAVHVPIPVYKYDPVLLEQIHWSGAILDPIFKNIRETHFPAASWQFYCSPKGFMRFYPAMWWNMETISRRRMDSYDCRNTEWFVDGATAAKNIIIILDMSGSMHGQRNEIAKRAINIIFDTLSENDFFNIIKYNQNPSFLIPCFNRTLVQATLRNKELMKEALNSELSKPDSCAELDKTWALVGETLDSIENKTKNFGCNTAIMLITDASADFQGDVLKQLIGSKNVKFFSFIVGGDVTESQAKEVEQLACENRGTYGRIQNLADAQQKIQRYIDIMSRSIAQRARDRAIWTGFYVDRLSQNFVSTVAFSVVIDSKFRGVVGANAPITELQQMAAVYMLGANAYSFLVDNNGYVMFHPQLRPWIKFKIKPKPNFNSMDIMEMEVLQENSATVNGIRVPVPVNYNHPLRKSLSDGDSSKGATNHVLKVLIAIAEDEKIKRVYKQENAYYYRGIKGTFMTLGVAVPLTLKRILGFRNKMMDLRTIDMDWFADDYVWRLHPNWTYCRPNDTSGSMSKEEILVHYARQMKSSGKVPFKCENYSILIGRLLYDLKIISKFMASLPMSFELNKGVHSSFIATQTGLTHYKKFQIEGLLYNSTTISLNSSGNKDDVPFLQKYTKGLDETFYRRASMNQGALIIDVNLPDSVYLTNDSVLYETFNVQKSPLVRITKSVGLNEQGDSAPIGVQGVELLYINFADSVKRASNNVCHEGSKHRCYLIDEHGYVVYTSVVTNTSLLESHYLGYFFGHVPIPPWPDSFVMPTDRVEAYAFNKLVEKGYYENITYIDYQSMRKSESEKDKGKAAASSTTTTSAAIKIFNPFISLLHVLFSLIRLFAELFSNALLCLFFGASFFHAVEPSTTGSKESQEEGSPCDKWSPFYLLNKERAKKPIELFNGKIDCFGRKSSYCTASGYASPLSGTNLILVVIKVSAQCSMESCVKTRNESLPLFEMQVVSNASDKFASLGGTCENTQFEFRYRRSPSVCYAADDEKIGGKSFCEEYLKSGTSHNLINFILDFIALICITTFILFEH